jgi:hypothetical protein
VVEVPPARANAFASVGAVHVVASTGRQSEPSGTPSPSASAAQAGSPRRTVAGINVIRQTDDRKKLRLSIVHTPT